MSNGLSGASALAYQGTNAPTPPNVFVYPRAPTPNNYQGFSIGDFWVYQVSKTSNNNELWTLMGKAANIADWVLISGSVGTLISLTANSGGPVFPLLGNTNVKGDGTTINIVGNPATHTLTASAIGTGLISTLTGNSGGAVSPSAGNINVVGDGTTISIVGDPGTYTLTASVIGGEAANSFPTDSGTATPIAGVLNIKGLLGGNISTSASSNTVSVSVSGTTQYALQVGGASGALTSLSVGTNGQLPIGSAGANPVMSTLTAGTGIAITNGAGSISIASNGPPSYTGGTWIPVLSFGGATTGITYNATNGQKGSYYQIGNVVFVAFRINLTSKGSATGSVSVDGLPFTAAANPSPGLYPLATILGTVTFDASYTWSQALVIGGSTSMNIQECGSGQANVNMADTNFANTSLMEISGYYFM